MAVIIIVLAVVLVTGLMCCLRVASDADDEMERMMVQKDSE